METTAVLDRHTSAPMGATSTEPKHAYILTFDLSQKVQILRSIGIKTPDVNDTFFEDVRKEIVHKLTGYFPDSEIVSQSMQNLAEEIMMRAVTKKHLLQRGVVVSTCSEISRLRKGHTLEVNRIIDQDGKLLGIGPRPGFPPLDDQIQAIVSIANGDPLILVEDGTFTGNTVLYILDKLKRHNLSVAAIVIGFAFPDAVKKIESHFDGELIVVENPRTYIDWMPDHDFFPFIPNCGRVVGFQWRNQRFPLYSYNGASYSVPYLLTYCPFSEWTSINEKHAQDFTVFCAKAGLTLFERINKLNNRQITISDIMDIRPQISIPISVTQEHFPSTSTVITDYLSELCHMLF